MLNTETVDRATICRSPFNMSDKIDKNINSNNKNKNVDDSAEPESIETIAIVNTVLAYIHYGISSATPGNVIEVVLGHFTGEVILDAKLKLWKECELGDPPPWHNSRARKAFAAHLHDILDEIYKVDTICYAFLVESEGIARLPRFNAECLIVVSIDKRIAELKQECFALKVESSSYRHDYLKCMDQLDVMKTVLRQQFCLFGNNSVCLLLLDASKAFDKVSFEMLFELLLQRNVCQRIIILLLYMYVNQKRYVKWANELSEPFTVANGVKQGAVISPLLFKIYIDNLFKELKQLGQGCHVGPTFPGAFSEYLAPSEPIFQSLNVLNFEKIVVQRISLLMFKYTHGNVPVSVSQLFRTNNEYHNYNTRNCAHIHVPVGTTEASYRTFGYRGIYIWNHISQKIDINTSYPCFKNLVKIYIQNNNLDNIRLNY